MRDIINGLILISFTFRLHFLYRFPPWGLFGSGDGCKLGTEFGDIGPKLILFYFGRVRGGGGVCQVIIVVGFADVAEEIGSGPWYHDVLLEVMGLCEETLLNFSFMQLAEKFQVLGVAVQPQLVLFKHEGGSVVQTVLIE